jgi:hypothetical protein
MNKELIRVDFYRMELKINTVYYTREEYYKQKELDKFDKELIKCYE